MWCSRAGYRSIGYQSNSPGPQGVQGAAAGRDRLSRLVGLSRIHVEVPPLARGPRGVMGPPGGDTHLKGHQQGGELKTSRGRVGRNTSATTKMLNQDDRTSIGAREEHGAALAADAPSKYERSPGGSWADVFEPADPLVAAAVLGHARDGDCRAAPAGSILRRCLRAQAAQPLRCTARPTLLIAKPGYPYRSAAWSSGQQVNRSTLAMCGGRARDVIRHLTDSSADRSVGRSRNAVQALGDMHLERTVVLLPAIIEQLGDPF